MKSKENVQGKEDWKLKGKSYKRDGRRKCKFSGQVHKNMKEKKEIKAIRKPIGGEHDS